MMYIEKIEDGWSKNYTFWSYRTDTIFLFIDLYKMVGNPSVALEIVTDTIILLHFVFCLIKFTKLQKKSNVLHYLLKRLKV